MDDIQTTEPESYAHYTGDGSTYVTGIPARDMTRDEWDGIRDDLKALALGMGLYEIKEQPDAAPAPTANIIKGMEYKVVAPVKTDATEDHE
jgi:hypothetical protein